MERFLQRMEYAGDRTLVSFAHLIDEQFFGEKKDILVSDESAEYRAPLIVAMIASFLERVERVGASDVDHGRVLVLTEREDSLGAFTRLLAEVGIGGAIVGSEEVAGGLATRLCSEPVVAMPASIFLSAAEQGYCMPRDFGLLIIDGADLFSERPSEIQRKMWGYLLPPWERRAALFATHVGIRTKNTAIDFANNPKTVVLKKAQASLSAISTSMYRVGSEHKFNVLLSLIHEQCRKGHAAILVFCNLRQTSREVEARLRLNHVRAEQLLSSTSGGQNEALLQQFSNYTKDTGAEGEPFVLLVSNDTLASLPSECASVAIHYDIPLDADVYLERVRAMEPQNAAMIGLVCERYEVGLSAITSRFGVQFEMKEPSEEMVAYRDASEGVALERERELPFGGRETGVRRAKMPHGGPSYRGDRGKDAPVSMRPRGRRGKRGDASQPERREHKEREKRQSLYAMNTEERLAYFRKKYRNILKTPMAKPQQGGAEPQAHEPPPEDGAREPESGIVKRFMARLSPKDNAPGPDDAAR